MPRDDFSNDTKLKLAQRAGYNCSICGRLTVGPSSEGVMSVNLTGVAAHIAAASPGGRRYDHTMSHAQRSAIENGIWLCNTHSDLIDGDEITFTTSYLQTIKKIHEGRIKYQQAGINTERGAVIKIEISNFGPITTPIKMDFSDRNIIIGNNGIGKTLIFDLISALNSKNFLIKWKKLYGPPVSSNCNIYFLKNRVEKFSISMNRKRELSYSLDDAEIPLLIPALKVFYLNRNYEDFIRGSSKRFYGKTTVIENLSEYFRITVEEFVSVIKGVNRTNAAFANDISISENNKDLSVKFYANATSPILGFNDLSSGEKERVLLQIALKLATYYARFGSTLLLIEQFSFRRGDNQGINQLLEIIRTENFDFQFFFNTIPNEDYDLRGYKINTLIEKNGQIVVLS